ncbi:hypothetical protein NCC78_19710 [Micromonospora phytophila]|uniref:hypothetical protein n=1 Tax=Micromonospora phytophila TaxID=709888 RepID=UPI00202DD26B|nr:hypothetical protein [Micromonospora phytophila]MCM0676896.1 hypothetical protein [Micromonospora phytophila]
MDAIWSMGVRYRAVENVVDCYRTSRRAEGGDANRDGVSDLLRHHAQIGGPEQFATRVKNRQRVSTHPGGALSPPSLPGPAVAQAASTTGKRRGRTRTRTLCWAVELGGATVR